ncbi:hypothetical protein N7493_011140 [Penicillium malachiteum]|uniref:Uncharacterized protein n=1 Tax=Penicillium malachiteum TaxID=1324776 RepID=A0AAD6MR33_9EURO|nr:hypothetical protein N7493_011140 [Penicillium malachiteum]
MAEEPPERYNLRKALIMLNSEFNADPTTQRYDKDQLKENGISLQPMSLDRHSDEHPYFFAPYSKAPSLSVDTIQELQCELGSLREFIHQDGYSRAFHSYWDDYVDDNIRCDNKTV